MRAVYIVDWDGYQKKIYDSCDEWGGYRILKYILFK